MEFPDFDYLRSLAENNPQELNNLSERFSQQIIASAPERNKRRLEGLLFQINMERRRSKNPMHACISISRMMMDSYSDLQKAMIGLRDGDSEIVNVLPEVELMDNVIGFPVDK